jgi:hypothetical protein
MTVLLSVYSVIGQEKPLSVVTEQKNYYDIDCLGEKRILKLYNQNENLVFDELCNGSKMIKKELFKTVQKIELRNYANATDNYLFYEEYLNESNKKSYEINKEDFENKICLNVDTKVYSNIKIHETEFVQKKEAYKCVEKSDISRTEPYIEIFIDDKLVKTYDVNKGLPPIDINFNTFERINDDYEDYYIVEFSYNGENSRQVRIQDTTLKCSRDTFRISDEFNMQCNVSDDEAITQFIQIKDDKDRLFYAENRKVITQQEETIFNNNMTWLGIILVFVAIGIWRYTRKEQNEDKNSIDEIDEL